MEEFLSNIHFTNLVWALLAPLILMILDIITGYYNAWEKNEISSAKMRDGLGKKCAELCYIIVGIICKYAIGTSSVMYFMIAYVCYMEIVSLAENCDKLGFPLPTKWKEKLNNNVDLTETDDSTEEELSNGGEEDEIESNEQDGSSTQE